MYNPTFFLFGRVGGHVGELSTISASLPTLVNSNDCKPVLNFLLDLCLFHGKTDALKEIIYGIPPPHSVKNVKYE
jgi:hypothetical protein